jgi:hypothetical protein
LHFNLHILLSNICHTQRQRQQRLLTNYLGKIDHSRPLLLSEQSGVGLGQCKREDSTGTQRRKKYRLLSLCQEREEKVFSVSYMSETQDNSSKERGNHMEKQIKRQKVGPSPSIQEIEEIMARLDDSVGLKRKNNDNEKEDTSSKKI